MDVKEQLRNSVLKILKLRNNKFSENRRRFRVLIYFFRLIGFLFVIYESVLQMDFRVFELAHVAYILAFFNEIESFKLNFKTQ